MKGTVLNENSWHVKYYRWINQGDLPMGLCPYFWSVFAYIVFSPILIPVVLISKFLFSFTKKNIEKKMNDITILPPERFKQKLIQKEKFEKGVMVVAKVVMGALILGILSFIGYVVYGSTKKFGVFPTILTIVGGIAVLYGLMKLLFWWMERRDEKMVIKKINESLGINPTPKTNTSFVSIAKSSIVGFYKKNCPRITWVKK